MRRGALWSLGVGPRLVFLACGSSSDESNAQNGASCQVGTSSGAVEIAVTTFDHGIDVFSVPGSGDKCLLWPTGRGNLLRNGMGPNTVK